MVEMHGCHSALGMLMGLYLNTSQWVSEAHRQKCLSGVRVSENAA